MLRIHGLERKTSGVLNCELLLQCGPASTILETKECVRHATTVTSMDDVDHYLRGGEELQRYDIKGDKNWEKFFKTFREEELLVRA